MIDIAIIMASTRPGRRGEAVARWVHQQAEQHERLVGKDARATLIDLVEVNLPLLDESAPAMFGNYSQTHTKRWAEQIAKFDGFIFVTAEYNHGLPAALSNAIDFLFSEWNDKAAAFVSYGVDNGVRAVEQLRVKLTEVKVANVRSQVSLSLYEDFVIEDPVETGTFAPRELHAERATIMFNELLDWAGALQTLRLGGAENVSV